MYGGGSLTLLLYAFSLRVAFVHQSALSSVTLLVSLLPCVLFAFETPFPIFLSTALPPPLLNCMGVTEVFAVFYYESKRYKHYKHPYEPK